MDPAIRSLCHDLVNVCDELLCGAGNLRRSAEKLGQPWPNSEAALLINRVLDARITLYAALNLPLPKTKPQTTKATTP